MPQQLPALSDAKVAQLQREILSDPAVQAAAQYQRELASGSEQDPANSGGLYGAGQAPVTALRGRDGTDVLAKYRARLPHGYNLGADNAVIEKDNNSGKWVLGALAAMAAAGVISAYASAGAGAGAGVGGGAGTGAGTAGATVSGLAPGVTLPGTMATLPSLAAPAIAAAGPAAAAAVPAAAAPSAISSVAPAMRTVTTMGGLSDLLKPILQYGVPVAGQLIGTKMAANANRDAAEIQNSYLEKALKAAEEEQKYQRGRTDTQDARAEDERQYGHGQYANYLGRLDPYRSASAPSLTRLNSLLSGNQWSTPGQPAPAGSATTGGTVLLKAPDGRTMPVPDNQVDHYLQRGAVRA